MNPGYVVQDKEGNFALVLLHSSGKLAHCGWSDCESNWLDADYWLYSDPDLQFINHTDSYEHIQNSNSAAVSILVHFTDASYIADLHPELLL